MAERKDEEKDNIKPNVVLIAKCDALLKAIDDIHQEIKEHGESVTVFVYAAIAGPLCRLTKIIEPNVGKKIDEIIYVYEHAEENLVVNDKQHGADLLTENGDHIEIKTSVCKKTKGMRANFNWPLPKGNTEEERRKNLLDSIKEKTEGGGLITIAKDINGTVLQKYKISHWFLMGYFSRVPFRTCDVYNMACNQCETCKHFHRLSKMQQYSDLMVKEGLQDLNEEQWDHVFRKTKSDCKGVPEALVKSAQVKNPVL